MSKKNLKLMIFIPARKGSKGLINKNFINLNGFPLIHYTFNICKKLKLTHKTLVSTDDEKILDFAKSNGFDSGYVRPKKLSRDATGMYETLLDGILFYENKYSCNIKNILVLQPTSPLRLLSDIKKGIKFYFDNGFESLVSVRKVHEHPNEIIKINKHNKWNYILKNHSYPKIRQEYSQEYFFIDGSFYLISKNFLLRYKKFIIHNKTQMFKISQKYNVDIDDINDLKIAEALLMK